VPTARQKFSEVGSLLNARYKLTVELTFEKYYQRGVWNPCQLHCAGDCQGKNPGKVSSIVILRNSCVSEPTFHNFYLDDPRQVQHFSKVSSVVVVYSKSADFSEFLSGSI